jgi:hypothetical protein
MPCLVMMGTWEVKNPPYGWFTVGLDGWNSAGDRDRHLCYGNAYNPC